MFHNDRLVIGVGSVFVFKNPGKEELSPHPVHDEEIDWEYAQAELIATMDQENKKKTREAEQQQERESTTFYILRSYIIYSEG